LTGPSPNVCLCFVEEVPAAISHGVTLEEAKANLRDARRVMLDCQRELACRWFVLDSMFALIYYHLV